MNPFLKQNILYLFPNGASLLYSCDENRRREAKEMKKALLYDTLSASTMILGLQNESALTASLPSGEYRTIKSRPVRFFHRLSLEVYASARFTITQHRGSERECLFWTRI